MGESAEAAPQQQLLLVCSLPQDPINGIKRKATSLQKPGLLGALGSGCGKCREALRSDRIGARHFALGYRTERRRTDLVGDAKLSQVVANTRVAEALRAAAGYRACEALIGQEPVAHQLVENTIDFSAFILVADVQ